MSLLVPIRGVHSILRRFLSLSSRSDSLNAWNFLNGSGEDPGLEHNLIGCMTLFVSVVLLFEKQSLAT